MEFYKFIVVMISAGDGIHDDPGVHIFRNNIRLMQVPLQQPPAQ